MSNKVTKFEQNIAKLLFVYYHRLNSLIDSYKDQNIEFLFLPRAGITIKKHLNKYRETKNFSQLGDDRLFWINRTTAGSLIQDDTKYLRFLSDQIGKSSQRKYQSLVSSFSVALKHVSYADINLSHIEYLVKYTNARRKENFSMYKAYLESFKTNNFALIDSGWNGTTESILSDSFTNFSFSRINLGVLKRSPRVSALGMIFDNYI